MKNAENGKMYGSFCHPTVCVFTLRVEISYGSTRPLQTLIVRVDSKGSDYDFAREPAYFAVAIDTQVHIRTLLEYILMGIMHLSQPACQSVLSFTRSFFNSNGWAIPG